MPPIVMFKQRSRPSGLEFGSCCDCNTKTSGADLAAGFIARMHFTTADDTLTKEMRHLKRRINRELPGLARELERPWKAQETWPKINGVARRMIKVSADGPVLKALLNVFSTKMALALYREHVGQSLPEKGKTFSRWFLNAGLAQSDADAFLAKMPIEGELRQGRFSSAGQFYYRFNCDAKEVLAALVQFHTGLYIFAVATARPEYYLRDWNVIGASDTSASPGQLIAMLPPS